MLAIKHTCCRDRAMLLLPWYPFRVADDFELQSNSASFRPFQRTEISLNTTQPNEVNNYGAYVHNL
jgi:hypothetical protein